MATTLQEFSNELIATRENERRRIASELHDGIGQRLCALKFRLEVDLKASNEGRQRTPAHVLESAIQNLQETLIELHRIALDLQPLEISEDKGVLDKLDILCREYLQAHPDIDLLKRCTVEEKDLPLALKVVVYRIVQEAFNNVAKHARASRVSLGLRNSRSGIRLVVADNGAGFDTRQDQDSVAEGMGLGLESMRERARSTGGSLAIRSQPGGGTTVEVHWPASALAHLAAD